MGIECVIFFFGVPTLTCLEEVPLGTILSVVVLLWGEEEPHSSHLTRTHAHTHESGFQVLLCLSTQQLPTTAAAPGSCCQ